LNNGKNSTTLKPAPFIPLVIVVLLLTSCGYDSAVSGPEGRLAILPSTAFQDSSWRSLNAPQDQYGYDEMFGKSALFLINGEDDYQLFRKTKATLLSNPFLSWEWYLRPFLGHYHPVKLTIGFRSSQNGSGGWVSGLGGSLPSHDRLLTIAWAETPQLSGSLRKHGNSAFYFIGGGEQGINRWRQDAVDLASLYQRTWPEDDPTLTQIAFIGIAVKGGMTATRGHITNLLLTR